MDKDKKRPETCQLKYKPCKRFVKNISTKYTHKQLTSFYLSLKVNKLLFKFTIIFWSNSWVWLATTVLILWRVLQTRVLSKLSDQIRL